ncbi:hypothetical protein Bca101_011965 [Brassica carinata]
MPMRHLNAIATLLMMFFTPLILSFIGILEFPSASTSLPYPDSSSDDAVSSDPFRDVLVAFIKWDLEVGCARFRENHHKGSIRGNVSSGSLQESGSLGCGGMKMDDVRVLVKVCCFHERWCWFILRPRRHGRASSIP